MLSATAAEGPSVFALSRDIACLSVVVADLLPELLCEREINPQQADTMISKFPAPNVLRPFTTSIQEFDHNQIYPS
jgi:hypothetical protein